MIILTTFKRFTAAAISRKARDGVHPSKEDETADSQSGHHSYRMPQANHSDHHYVVTKNERSFL